MVLALAGAAEKGELCLHVRLDERSAGFFALGLALESRRPVVVVTTSGTAAAELHPAVAEAGEASVPLIVLSADRPASLQQVGAPQTMRQAGLFSSSVRFETSVEAASLPEWSWRSFGSRCYWEAAAHPAGPGPVHLNLGFDEPLLAEPDDMPPGRPDRRPWHRVSRESSPAPAGIAEDLASRRGVVVAGGGILDAASVVALAHGLGWPLLADPLSGARVAGSIGAVDAIVAAPDSEALVPEVVLRLGRPWASKTLSGWLAEAGEVILADHNWRWSDPERLASQVLSCTPAALAEAVSAISPQAPRGWLSLWRQAEKAAQESFEVSLATLDAPEPLFARRLWEGLGAEDTLMVASSMPVRDLEVFAAPRAAPPKVLANRGVNGIDGTTSTALGIAAARRESPGRTLLLVGDLAFLHDASALLSGAILGQRGAPDLDVVVVDNSGGGIFSFLAQSQGLPETLFESLFGTPQAADVLEVAASFGASVGEVSSAEEVLDEPPAKGVRVWRFRSERGQNVVAHREILAHAKSAVSGVIRRHGDG